MSASLRFGLRGSAYSDRLVIRLPRASPLSPGLTLTFERANLPVPIPVTVVAEGWL